MNLVYSISNMRLYIQTPAFSLSIPANSGKGPCLNNPSYNCQKAHFEGPIPTGQYIIDPTELSDPGIVGDIARNYRPDSPGDWGDFRIPIKSIGSGNRFGRSGFYIHGGSISGSAGCIDIGGGLFGNASTKLFKQAVSMASGPIALEVRR
ncbi:MAG: DUF2778 domain-containing protein [Gammaproteobacteria bacterium]|nr:DUF2778 domain-containing protein [Gammaproteobacteria bacterium]